MHPDCETIETYIQDLEDIIRLFRLNRDQYITRSEQENKPASYFQMTEMYQSQLETAHAIYNLDGEVLEDIYDDLIEKFARQIRTIKPSIKDTIQTLHNDGFFI